MQKPNFQQLNQIRAQGLRPQVVGCFLNNKKVLLVYKKEHNLWQLPQGGIDNRETIDQAFKREMAEELGNVFINSCDKEPTLIGQDAVKFPAPTQDSRELKTDQGKNIFMKGKKYFFVTITTKSPNLDINQTEFDDYKWLSYNEAMELSQTIYQKGKKRITLKALDILKKFQMINGK